jgi:hypothetical protein
MVYSNRGATEAIFQAQRFDAPADDGYGRTFTGNRGTYEVYLFNNSGYTILHGFDLGKTIDVETGIQTGVPAHLTTLYYKMQGWYAAGSVYETWISINSPGNTPNPSGHTLTNITIVDYLLVAT